MKKTVYCLRGLPGMGKTKLANRIAHGRADCVIVSADDFFMKDGEYKHDAEKLDQAHEDCFYRFMNALANPSIYTVVIDNVNCKREHFAHYRRLAINKGAAFIEVMVGNLDVETSHRRNTHNVPIEKIQKWVMEWEQ